MSTTLAFLAGFLAMATVEWLASRYMSEESFRSHLEIIARRRGWSWLTDHCHVAVAREQAYRARAERDMLGACFERLKALTYCDRLAFGPAGLGAGEQFIRVNAGESFEGLRPFLTISGQGRTWVQLPLEEATPEAVLEALGPASLPPLAVLISRTSDRELQRLPGVQRTALVHSLLREDEIPGVVEGLAERHRLFQKGKQIDPRFCNEVMG